MDELTKRGVSASKSWNRKKLLDLYEESERKKKETLQAPGRHVEKEGKTVTLPSVAATTKHKNTMATTKDSQEQGTNNSTPASMTSRFDAYALYFAAHSFVY